MLARGTSLITVGSLSTRAQPSRDQRLAPWRTTFSEPQLSMTSRLLIALLVAFAASACKTLAGLPTKPQKNLVIVLGTEHGRHTNNEVYTLERIEEIIRRVDPHHVLCEIPPDRMEDAWQGFIRTGEVTEPRVKLYPEFSEVLFPMALEGRFKVIPCSAWTETMANRRRLLLEQWRSTRIEDTREVDEAQERGARALELADLDQDPVAMHTAAFDAIVAESMEPYERLFSRDLGEGGWTQINLAHYSLISEALDELQGNGERILVIFGSWHKYRLRELLGERDDIVMRRLSEIMGSEGEALFGQ